MNTVVKAYEEFIRNHEPFFSAVDDMARSFLLLIPGRYGRSELASESLHVLLNLITFHHNLILGRPSAFSALLAVPATQKTRNLQNMLTVLQNVDVLLEMFAKCTLTVQNRWRFILLIESLKVCYHFHNPFPYWV